MKILVATEKPFVAAAVNGIKDIARNAGKAVFPVCSRIQQMNKRGFCQKIGEFNSGLSMWQSAIFWREEIFSEQAPCKTFFPRSIFFAALRSFAFCALSAFRMFAAKFQTRQKKVEKERFNILNSW